MVEPMLLGMIATAGIHILIEVITHAARNHDNYVAKRHGKPINHDLQKALQRSFLSAQQAIALTCQQKEKKGSPSWIWLEQKFKALANDLKEVSPPDKIMQLFDSLEHLQSFLVSDPQLTEQLNQETVKKRLIEFALEDDPKTPLCYYSQVKARLFEEVRDYFIREIKFNEPVRSILMAGSLAEMTSKINLLQHGQERLEQGQTEMMKLLTELRDFRAASSWQAKMKLDIDLNSSSSDQILAILEAVKQQGLTTLRIEAGSIIVVVEGSETAICQLENLTEIAGCRVESVTILPGYSVVSLLKWLQKQFDESVTAGWQTLEEIFGHKELAFGFRGNKTERAKEFNLGKGAVVVLLVQIEEKKPDIQVTLEVRAKDKRLLPVGLILFASQDTGAFQKSRVGENDDFIKQVWLFSPGETFTVTLSLRNVDKTELFSI